MPEDKEFQERARRVPVVEIERCVGRTPSGGYVYLLKGGGYLRYPDDSVNFLDFWPKPKNRSPHDPPAKIEIEPLTLEEYRRSMLECIREAREREARAAVERDHRPDDPSPK
jgi:hypothetical protein